MVFPSSLPVAGHQPRITRQWLIVAGAVFAAGCLVAYTGKAFVAADAPHFSHSYHGAAVGSFAQLQAVEKPGMTNVAKGKKTEALKKGVQAVVAAPGKVVGAVTGGVVHAGEQLNLVTVPAATLEYTTKSEIGLA
jgi:hypothetical protein